MRMVTLHCNGINFPVMQAIIQDLFKHNQYEERKFIKPKSQFYRIIKNIYITGIDC